MTTLAGAMEKSISAADANRKFSQLLRGVKTGQSYVVTSHGRPVARIAPVEEGSTVASSARSSLLERLRSERVLNIGRWKRDELYD
jgi:prevent-host-death family protein